jgi:hypothetical protein
MAISEYDDLTLGAGIAGEARSGRRPSKFWPIAKTRRDRSPARFCTAVSSSGCTGSAVKIPTKTTILGRKK